MLAGWSGGPACGQPAEDELQEPARAERDKRLHPSVPRERAAQSRSPGPRTPVRELGLHAAASRGCLLMGRGTTHEARHCTQFCKGLYVRFPK